MKRMNYLCIALLLGVMGVQAQQLTYSPLVIQNPVMLNPAETGYEDNISVLLNYKRQWTGIDKAPTSYNLYAEYGKLDGMGLGLQVQKESSGLLDLMRVKGTYAYHLQLAEKKELLMGVNVGMIQYQFLANDAEVTQTDDPVLLQGNSSATAFSADVGFAYIDGKLTVGLAIPQLFSTNLQFDTKEMAAMSLNMHYLAYARYHYEMSDILSLYPFIMYKGAQEAASGQIDAGVGAVYKKDMGLGLIYRTNYGLQIIIDARVSDLIQVQYAFGLASGDISNVASGTHEIGLKLTF